MEPDESTTAESDTGAYAEPVAEEYIDETAGGYDEAYPAGDAPAEATGWPLASPSGEHLRVSYPESGGFRYEVGPEPASDPFAGWTEDVLDEAVDRIDTLATDAPAQGVRLGDFQEANMAPLDPEAPRHEGKEWRDPLKPPGEFDYQPGETPGTDSYHGSMGRRLERQALDEDGRPRFDANGEPVMEEYFSPAEEFSITPGHDTFAVRVGPAGSFVDHVFDSEDEAIAYARELSQRGAGQIRDDSSLPRTWPGGAEGNPVDKARVFRIPPSTPFLRSGVAPQPESTPGMTEVYYEGGGAQTQLPKRLVTDERQVAEFDIEQ